VEVKSLHIRLFFLSIAICYTDVNSLNTLQLVYSRIHHLYITHISKLIEVSTNIITPFLLPKHWKRPFINSPSLNFRVLTLSFITTSIKIRIFLYHKLHDTTKCATTTTTTRSSYFFSPIHKFDFLSPFNSLHSSHFYS